MLNIDLSLHLEAAGGHTPCSLGGVAVQLPLSGLPPLTADPRSSVTPLGQSRSGRNGPGGAWLASTGLRMTHLARRVFSLPAVEFLDFVRAHASLARAKWLLLTRPKGALLRTVASSGPSGGASGAASLERLVLALNRAAEYGLFRPTCLVRAVALERMLEASGVRGAVVRVGVRPAGQELLAHAWVELEGRVIGDDPTRVSRFAPLSDFSALPR